MIKQANIDMLLPVVSQAFVAEHLPPELGAAIAHQESEWNPEAAAMSGGDGARGGSYGLCQMSLKTALGLDKAATAVKLLNPDYNCRLAAKLCRVNWNVARGRVEDVVAMYNSGKPFFAAPDSTKLVYVPNVLKYMSLYTERCAQYRTTHLAIASKI